MTSAVDTLASSLYRFLSSRPDIIVSGANGRPDRRRPVLERDLDIHHFSQTWSNTATMFSAEGTLSGQAFTRSYTTVITHEGRAHVFCDGMPAYVVEADCGNLIDDMREGALVDMGTAAIRYDGFAMA